jgi:hypothetical protein
MRWYASLVFRVLLAITLAIVPLSAQRAPDNRIDMPFADARPVLEAFADHLPAALHGQPAADRSRLWDGWVVQHDQAIRARVERGDEDSLINFLLFGTTFTRQPRAVNDSRRLGGRERAGQVVRNRIDDLVAAIDRADDNERLSFARALLRRRGLDPGNRDQVRRYIVETMRRMVGEVDGYVKSLDAVKGNPDSNAELAARATLFHDRGLSSDTSLLPDFAVDQSLAQLAAAGLITPRSVRRIAVVGPGLDFTDKAEGFDFYPVQTLQPFAIIDSLLRLGLATPGDVRLTTFDVNPHVNEHLASARRGASTGAVYVLSLPRDLDVPWRPDLAAYWQRFGDRIGEPAVASTAPDGAGGVQVRAVRVRAEVVASLLPEDLDIVVQRLDPVVDSERFDLVVATNVFVYYDTFEQSLAMVNLARMMRSGAVLLSNNALPALNDAPLRKAGATDVVYTDRPDDRDHVFWLLRP